MAARALPARTEGPAAFGRHNSGLESCSRKVSIRFTHSVFPANFSANFCSKFGRETWDGSIFRPSHANGMISKLVFFSRNCGFRLNASLDSSSSAWNVLDSQEENLNWPYVDESDSNEDMSEDNDGERVARVSSPEPSSPYIVLNFYHFTSLDDPHGLVKLHREFMEGKNILGRIYVSEQGINAQLSGPENDVLSYATFVKSNPIFSNIHLQISPSPIGHAFPRLKLRYKQSLVQVEGGTKFLPVMDTNSRAIPLSPREWREKIEKNLMGDVSIDLESNLKTEDEMKSNGETEPSSSSLRTTKSLKKTLLLDVRNGYEWDVGHFKGAVRPNVDSFRTTKFGISDASTDTDETSFDDPLEGVDKENTDVLMYCTGGIRCDVYSTMLKQKGFRNLYTLQGGIANYLKEEGGRHWFGNLFVFDSRLSVPPRYYQTRNGDKKDQTSDENLGSFLSNESDTVQKNDGKTINQRVDDATVESLEDGELPHCSFCNVFLKMPRHRNCANLDCNALFLSCDACSETRKGACSEACSCAERMRPFLKEGLPYQRWHNYRPSEPKSLITEGRSTRASRRRERRQARKEMEKNAV